MEFSYLEFSVKSGTFGKEKKIIIKESENSNYPNKEKKSNEEKNSIYFYYFLIKRITKQIIYNQLLINIKFILMFRSEKCKQINLIYLFYFIFYNTGLNLKKYCHN